MAGYSRADYEFELGLIEQDRHTVRLGLLLPKADGGLDGFKAKEMFDMLDRRERALNMKLAMIAQSIGDNAKRKAEKYVKQHKQEAGLLMKIRMIDKATQPGANLAADSHKGQVAR